MLCQLCPPFCLWLQAILFFIQLIYQLFLKICKQMIRYLHKLFCLFWGNCQAVALTKAFSQMKFVTKWVCKSCFLAVGNFHKKITLLHSHENQSKLLGYQGWVKILMITLVYSKRVSVRNNLLHSVCQGTFSTVDSRLTKECFWWQENYAHSGIWIILTSFFKWRFEWGKMQ